MMLFYFYLLNGAYLYIVRLLGFQFADGLLYRLSGFHGYGLRLLELLVGAVDHFVGSGAVDLLQLILCFFQRVLKCVYLLVQLFQLLVYIDCNFRSHIPIHLILQSVLHTAVSVIRFTV